MTRNKHLAELAEGREAVITGLGGSGRVRQRLLDMGLTRGAHVRVIGRAPLGDPIHVCIRGYHLALRGDEARHVAVEPSGA